uniref:Uncharacterized protein n=1 Tax=Vespula pensylvanica TaxID=30213 RepID=A0A834UEU6_VESPE|nr:hypothetical protein H0235_002987 [Vespula pensylvanica]
MIMAAAAATTVTADATENLAGNEYLERVKSKLKSPGHTSFDELTPTLTNSTLAHKCELSTIENNSFPDTERFVEECHVSCSPSHSRSSLVQKALWLFKL